MSIQVLCLLPQIIQLEGPILVLRDLHILNAQSLQHKLLLLFFVRHKLLILRTILDLVETWVNYKPLGFLNAPL